ncbi:MAG: pyruvate formate lyase family protein [Armatimonadota bacterium]
MNELLIEKKHSVREREHKRFRQQAPPDVLAECERENSSGMRRAALLIKRQCEAESVVIEPGERIVFTRTIPCIPRIYADMDPVCLINNICADWQMALSQGLLGRREAAADARERYKDNPQASEFLDCAIESIDAVLALAARYAQAAEQMGRHDIAQMLRNVPANAPRSFHEALQSLKFMHSALWLAGHYHVGLGRFDQYMWTYLEADLKSGVLTESDAEDLLAEFFISLNKDTDVYYGVQRGDNGQSIMLGGVKRDGSDAVNPLTRMVLRVVRDVGMIDPKINLRINADTDLDLLCLATELTSKGLGFPQYANDDVVIPSLVAHGYDLEDARDYSVAACWEFIIPGKGMEIVNYETMRFPKIVDQAIRNGLAAGDTFDGILNRVKVGIDEAARRYADCYSKRQLPPAPFYSVLMDDCIENGRDLSSGVKYNNVGIHGACSASAADALAAVKKHVFDQHDIDPADLLAALDADYDGFEDIKQKLQNDSPKVGNNDDAADSMLTTLFDYFADACEKLGDHDGKWIMRPGTGSAMFYLYMADEVGATAEGRKKGEYFSANLAPAPNIRVHGPISVLQTYSKIDYKRVCNGGPITMELSDAVFRDQDSVRKVAMLVRTFAQLGCQQLQLNTLNYEKLMDAKAHPERHRDLIVRVWGWSGYFCELAPEYQEHVINRYKYAL